jgi:hypothetical protein
MMPFLRRGLGALVALGAIVVVPMACQSGGVGDPCAPEDEYDPEFSGFDLGQEYIESRSFQCKTRICLVNHFQGRVSCPLGQSPTALADCGPDAPHDDLCKPGERCVAVGGEEVPKRFVCHDPTSCQTADGTAANNEGKACCVPGTDQPIAGPVCGQCDKPSRRNADDAVYCSCRCGVADGEPDEPNFDFCACPDGFTCAQIRPNLGFPGERLTGKYCVKNETVYKNDASCGEVAGYHEAPCQGLGLP